MIITLIFIFFLILENLVLPAIIGPKFFSIVPIFLMSLVIYRENNLSRLIQVLVLFFAAELFIGIRIGTFLIPFTAVTIIYLWLNRYWELGSGLRESGSIVGIIMGILVVAILFYIYSLIFIIIESGYDINQILEDFTALFKASAFSTIAWALGFIFLMKYVLKPKQNL